MIRQRHLAGHSPVAVQNVDSSCVPAFRPRHSAVRRQWPLLLPLNVVPLLPENGC